MVRTQVKILKSLLGGKCKAGPMHQKPVFFRELGVVSEDKADLLVLLVETKEFKPFPSLLGKALNMKYGLGLRQLDL